jgi:phage RecT family recombinase
MANQLAVIEKSLTALRPQFAEMMEPLRRFGVSPDRIVRSVVISCDRTPKLLRCDLSSIIQAATTGAMLGLEADGATGQGYLLPFNRRGGAPRAQWATGYKGYNTLAARVGLTINGGIVREGDDIWDWEKGSAGFVRHKAKLDNPGQIIAAWATATAPGRTPIIEVIGVKDLLFVKDRSKASKRDDDEDGEAFSPWNDQKIGFPAMCEKTAKRRLSRSVPLSSFVLAAVIDEAHEERGLHAFLHPNRGVVIEGHATPADELVPQAQRSSEPREIIERVRQPRFIIRGLKGDLQFTSIEQWRAKWFEEIPKMKPEVAEQFNERNAVLFDEYAASEQHLADVKAVVDALRKRME